jgi:hypothetical protein
MLLSVLGLLFSSNIVWAQNEKNDISEFETV